MITERISTLAVFFCVLIGLVQVSSASAQVGEERWNYTILDVADLRGENRYRISSASVMEVIRSQVQTGELKYEYTLKEAAGQVAGQEQPFVFTAPKSWVFYKDPVTHKLRTEDKELVGLFNLMNRVVEKLPKERKQIGNKWQQAINIGNGSEFLPGKVVVNFEIQDISQADYAELTLIRYSSEELTFRAMDAEGGQVKAKFSGFITYDPEKELIIHMVWDFSAVRSRLDKKSDLFNHSIIYFMSDARGETPVVPFGIYPGIAKTAAESRARLTKIVSDPEPPEWFWQTLFLSKMSWSIAGITAEESANPLPKFAAIGEALLIGIGIGIKKVTKIAITAIKGTLFTDSVRGEVTGFSLTKWALEKVGLEPQHAEIIKEIIHLAGIGPKEIGIGLKVAATEKVVRVASRVDNLKKLVDVMNIGVRLYDLKVDMIPPPVMLTTMDFLMINAIQDSKQLAVPFQPIAEPFLGPINRIPDTDKLTGRNQIAGQDIPLSNYTFTQTMDGFYTEIIKDISLADFSITFTGAQTGLPFSKNFSGNMSGEIVFNPGVPALNLIDSQATMTATGTVSGKIGSTLTGTMNISGTLTHDPYFIEKIVPAGQIKIGPDGSLSKIGPFGGPFKDDAGTTIGAMTVDTLTQTPK